MQDLRDFLGSAGRATADFFATFTPADWTTGAIAALAVLVGIFALIQNHQTRLRPRLLLSDLVYEPIMYTHPIDGPWFDERLDVTITNRGAGNAVDVTVTFPKDNRSVSIGTLKLDDSESARFNVQDFDGPGPYPYVVTWREYPPRDGKLRSKEGAVTINGPTA
jgi:hypothetical protein